jgi:hypothetical protein
MAKYIYDREHNCMVDKDTGMPMLNQEEKARPLQTPKTFSDLPGYQSPIDGTWVEGRRARKYDLDKNNCVDANDFTGSKPRGFKNEKFAKKRGVEHLLK